MLAEPGAGMSDVVRCGVFLGNMADFQPMSSVCSGFFPSPYPREPVWVSPSAGSLVEIDCVAVLPSGN